MAQEISNQELRQIVDLLVANVEQISPGLQRVELVLGNHGAELKEIEAELGRNNSMLVNYTGRLDKMAKTITSTWKITESIVGVLETMSKDVEKIKSHLEIP